MPSPTLKKTTARTYYMCVRCRRDRQACKPAPGDRYTEEKCERCLSRGYECGQSIDNDPGWQGAYRKATEKVPQNTAHIKNDRLDMQPLHADGISRAVEFAAHNLSTEFPQPPRYPYMPSRAPSVQSYSWMQTESTLVPEYGVGKPPSKKPYMAAYQETAWDREEIQFSTHVLSYTDVAQDLMLVGALWLSEYVISLAHSNRRSSLSLASDNDDTPHRKSMISAGAMGWKAPSRTEYMCDVTDIPSDPVEFTEKWSVKPESAKSFQHHREVSETNDNWRCPLADEDQRCKSPYINREALIGHLFIVHRVRNDREMQHAIASVRPTNSSSPTNTLKANIVDKKTAQQAANSDSIRSYSASTVSQHLCSIADSSGKISKSEAIAMNSLSTSPASDHLDSDSISDFDPVIESANNLSFHVYLYLVVRLCCRHLSSTSLAKHVISAPGDANGSACPTNNEAETASKTSQTNNRKRGRAESNIHDANKEGGDYEDVDDGRPSKHPAKEAKITDVDVDFSYACPFYKAHPERYSDQRAGSHPYRHCGSCYLKDIPTLKVHLRRKHQKPEFYCPTCWTVYKSALERDHHLVKKSCSTVNNPFLEKMTDDAAVEIKRRRRNEAPINTWYFLFDTLFPRHPVRPDSPYADGRTSVLHNFAVKLFRALGLHAEEAYNNLTVNRLGVALPPLEAWVIEEAYRAFVSTVCAGILQGSSLFDSVTTLLNATPLERLPPEIQATESDIQEQQALEEDLNANINDSSDGQGQEINSVVLPALLLQRLNDGLAEVYPMPALPPMPPVGPLFDTFDTPYTFDTSGVHDGSSPDDVLSLFCVPGSLDKP